MFLDENQDVPYKVGGRLLSIFNYLKTIVSLLLCLSLAVLCSSFWFLIFTHILSPESS